MIGDFRFANVGLRVPKAVSSENTTANQNSDSGPHQRTAQDLQSLINGMGRSRAAQNMDAVIAAAVLAFGFVYIHWTHSSLPYPP